MNNETKKIDINFSLYVHKNSQLAKMNKKEAVELIANLVKRNIQNSGLYLESN